MSAELGGPVLETVGVSWSVGGIHIIRDVSLQLRRGEFLSVIGPNGAGKSSMINLLSGSVRATSGSILFDTNDVTSWSSARRARHGLGRTFQTSSIFNHLTVLENVRLAAQAKLGKSSSLVRWPRPQDEATERAHASLAEVALDRSSRKTAGELTHGDKRKLEIAVVAVQEPTVLLLDEPTSGASAEEVDVIIEIARRIHRAGNSVLMVEHRIELVETISDRVAVMHHGSLLMVDTPEIVLADSTVQSAYLGEGL
jgi:branched-chain amino acid transport system ATP-binding protein